MKVLYVTGDDYCALDFEEYVKENELTFEQASKIKKLYEEEDEEINEIVVIEELEFGEVCPKFMEFVKSKVEDYENSKHKRFYTEQDEIFKH